MRYRELSNQRSLIRICKGAGGSHLEISSGEGQKPATFPCTVADLRAAIAGKAFRSGSLIVQKSESNLWFIFSIDEPPVEDSCLVPCAEVGAALDELSSGGIAPLIFALAPILFFVTETIG